MSFGLTPAQATAYAAVNSAFQAALTAATTPATRTRITIEQKNVARANLKSMAADLAKIIDGTSTVTDAQRIELGLSVRKTPAPIPAPATSPDIDIVATTGRTVKIRLHDSTVIGRGRPEGVEGAAVFSYVGATPPADTADWKFEMNTSKMVEDVIFAPEVPNGALVWLTAFWIGTRMESGPACTPVSTNIPGGMTMAA
jgi:hypothetical protein